jgi:hypothetical protein
MSLPPYEKLASFYLGKQYDVEQGAVGDGLLLYDAKDLCTHAVCVGMTGSGKTGLCVSLLEEAALDGVPAIVVDPKGDLANLLLTFPDLKPDDFLPWVDEGAAIRKGMSVEEFAAYTATMWREGLASWGQEPERITRLREAVDFGLYTPGSTAATPMSVVKSFAAPSAAVLEDGDAFRERIAASTASLMALMGIDGDPLTSREHILVSNLLAHHWKQGQSLDLPGMIRGLQDPPFAEIGVFEVDAFFPPKDRLQLAMRLNNLVASPTFAAWMAGEPLDIQRLLYTPAGKPRVSILSIAHLSDTERMFFLTLLLSELVAWMRSQPGTSSLRALFYMDEVFGYLPPTANPPSKQPLLTLLKQARAFGLGCVLATQNPVDLDYKGLSNAGTWLIGRLQTARDQARVMEGLEGASAAAGKTFDKQQMERTIAGLGSRVFLLNNVHDEAPTVFHTRWAMSYLRGPLTRSQLKILHNELRPAAETAAIASPPGGATVSAAAAVGEMPTLTLDDLVVGRSPAGEEPPSLEGLDLSGPPSEAPTPSAPARPELPPDVDERFLAAARPAPKDGRLVYRPALLARGKLHYVRAGYQTDHWEDLTLLAPLPDPLPDDVWPESGRVDPAELQLADEPAAGIEFGRAPSQLSGSRTFAGIKNDFVDHLYRNCPLTVYHCPELKLYSQAGETEGEFRTRLTQLAREERDRQSVQLRQSYSKRWETLKEKIKTAEAAVKRESGEFREASFDSAVSMGSSLLDAFLGKKWLSKTNVSKAKTSMKTVGKAAEQRADIAEAKQKLAELEQEQAALQGAFQKEIDALESSLDPARLQLDPLELPPRKNEISVEEMTVAWTPWVLDASGGSQPATEIGEPSA